LDQPPAVDVAIRSESPATGAGHDGGGLAIVGISCHFPDAAGVERFWENLVQGRDGVRRPTAEELLARGVSARTVEDPRFVAAQATIDGKDLFDPAFFKISPRDAERMHPQLRLLLTHAWSAVEDAGYAADDIPDTAVFMSASGTPYGSSSGSGGPDEPRILTEFGPYQEWLLAQGGTIPTIVSHRLGLRGPSYLVHSNCSSSLVALSLASEALDRGDVHQALVGAACLLPQWSTGYLHQEGLNFSSDGRVKAFDADADGMIGGEGVAVIMLKRAADALRDGDHIYALIRSVAVNNDGSDKAGFYAPSVRGQAEVIGRALERAGVTADAISYVEAHGTGTALGDPIEFAALDEAFRAQTNEVGFCGLGSVKSNIGHLDTAAGLAGIIKAALALQHGIIPPTAHFSAISPRIPLEGSPFFIAEAARPFPEGTPPRAAVSSFGIGGTNAHAILEQAPGPAPQTASEARPQLFTISARDGERLADYVQQLLPALEKATDADLADIAFTLQVGRRAMEERLAVVASTKAELIERLSAWSEGKAAEGVFAGATSSGERALASIAGDEDFAHTLSRWFDRERLPQLAELWVSGHALDWRRLPRAAAPRRRRLPTYPFARERYWTQDAERRAAPPLAAPQNALHPLLHENASNLWGQRFRSRFTGREFFLADHMVKDEPVLPGVAHLEIARAAAERSFADPDAAIRLSDVVWLRPVTAREGVSLTVELELEDEDRVAWSIRADSEAEDAPFSRGRATIERRAEAPRLDVDALRRRCVTAVSSQECYAHFGRLGFAYGPAQQALVALMLGTAPEGGAEVLAEIALPTAATGDGFGLHPSILDAALQARIGLDPALTGGGGAAAASMPFAVDDVQIYGASPMEGVVWVRASAGESGAMAKLDIDLADREGEVRVAMRGFASRPINEPAVQGVLLARREWIDAPPPAAPAGEFEDHVIVLCARLERARSLEEALAEAIPSARVVIAPHEASSAAAGYIAAASELLVELKSLIADRPQRDVLVQVAICDSGDWMLFEGLSGLLATAGMEQPRLCGQVSSFAASASAADVAAGLRQDAASPHQGLMRRLDGARRVAEWREIPAPADAGTPPWRDGGVYLVTGGFGGLGLLFAEEIARRAKAVTLVLAGRSAPGAEAKRRIAALEAGGAKVIGHALDVSDAAAVKTLIEEVTAVVGPLSGVLHAAGVLRDGLIARKSVIELEEVMAAKVKGAANLDEATAAQPLELFVLFASGSGALGNVGQSDYAAANGFLDAFASRRNGRVASGERRGRTIAVDWPLWAEGGMRVDASSDRMRRERGAVPLPTEAGLRAFEAALASSQDQVLVLSGELRRLRNDISPPPATAEAPAPAVSAPLVSGAPEREGLRDEAAAFLKKRLAAVVKLPPSRIDTDAELERYGIDSVMAIELTTALEGPFGPLSKTLFFERRTVGELADYFLANHREKLVELLGAPAGPAVAPTPSATPPAARRPEASAPRRQKGRLASPPRPARARGGGEPLDVAIIGLAGRYPRARNVAEFWENLKGGRDCITEIPPTRWDHSRYFDPDKGKSGKTYGKWGGFIDGVDECDPLFFNISPREMEAIDPQERLFLQCVYEAVEDAGYTRDTLAADREGGGNVGVYVGVMYEEYQLYGAQAQLRGAPITLTGSPASIANRVSYYFNFNGPSVAVDTMCSSSLTAVHLACRDLAYGCEYAIAGGVNVSVHPNKYLFLGQFGFISSQGRCASFGQGGDGYVPGEGVGAVLLKPLSRAVADGDRIYGVIRATAVNHGGKTNGYTVPNPQAQGRVIERALREAGVDARAVSYVEAHGTGTSLGDPIEIAGLSRAFGAFTPERGFCAIGSAKSNIGHCESAAGIAGLTKVLLQLKHGQIAPSLHAETLNPHIDFDATPFVVQRELAEWRRPTIAAPGGPREYPRIAGISSFGAGGSNAHVVVEEYVAPPEARRRPAGPSVIVLSARTEEQLRARAADLLAAIRSGSLGDDDLADMAFTLQLGREALERRLALTASSMAQAADLLQRHLDGEAEIDGLWRGEGRREREGALGLLGDEDLSGVVERWFARGQLGRLAEAWTKGVAVDWRRLHAEATPRRLQLPTYPFARNRLWPAEAHDKMTAGPDGAEHPLLHRNISDLFGQKFRTRFSGDEPFLAGHVVNGQKILPGVAHLEMARAALEKALGSQPSAARLLDTVWLRPVVVEGQLEAQLHVEADEDGGLSWTLQGDGAAGEEPTLYSSGRAELIEIADAPRVDVTAIASRCLREVAIDDCYRRFLRLGLDYGAAMRGLVRLSIGQDEAGRREVLAEVAEPDSGTRSCALSPSVMDAALQATLALEPSFELAESDASAAPLPFAVEEVSAFAPTPARGFVWARLAEGASRSDPIVKIDLDILDEDGRVCAALRGLAGRRAASSLPEAASPHQDPGAVLLTPSWEVAAPTLVEPWPSASDRVVILASASFAQALQNILPHAVTLECDPSLDVEALAARLGALGPLDHLIWAPPGGGAGAGATVDPLIAGQESGVLFGFRLLKALLALGYGERKLGLTVVTTQAAPIAPDDAVDPTDASVHGLIGSAAKEYGPAWRMRVLDVAAGALAPIDQLLRLPADPEGETLAWREGRWRRRRLIPTRLPQPTVSPYRDGGVYVVAGGGGGIGAAWTEHVIRTHGARVVWLGRRAEDETIRSGIARLAEVGPAPAYVQVDAADRNALAAAHEAILRSHGPVSGVIHSALVLKDASLARMDEATFRAALAAKVDVSVNLASVFGGASLDLILFFSSMISFAKSPGQSNYAAGCVFVDAFAHALRRSRGLNAKVMNWGWWGSVGIVATEAHRERMNRLGLGSVEPDEGMAALDVLLSGPVDQIAFLKTTRPLTIADGVADEMLLAAPQKAPSVIASLTQFEGRLHG
jgi:acyl transferase domain-containing protein/acyl carrier protein